MKILTLHSDSIEFEPKIKALKDAEDVEKAKQRFEECLVVFTAVEKDDEKNSLQIAEKTADEIKAVADQVKVNRIVLYPYVHLTSQPSSPSSARTILSSIEKILKGKTFEVSHAPFGWYKAFQISVKGHPLAELSRQISVEKEKAEPRAKIKEEFSVLDMQGKLSDPKKYKYKKGDEKFKILVDKEALKKVLPGLKPGEEPPYIKHIKRFGIDWEPMSDIGHMRFGPQGNLIFDLVAKYSTQLAYSFKIPVYSVRGTNTFNLAEKPIAEHAKLFGERMYELEIDKRRFNLRYSACFQQFAMMKDWTISYKNLPLGAFEIADSYRYEQSGELLLSFRLRKMTMPDLHILCRNVDEAKGWCLQLHKTIFREFGELGYKVFSLVNLTKEFYEENKQFFKDLLKIEKGPILLRFIPDIYYWKINVEHHIVDQMNHPREIATWQIDVGNAERFGIKYMDKDNKQKWPVIIHTATLGTIERYIYSVFDSALRKKNPALPLWLSPTQVRLCPLSSSFLIYCEKIAGQLEKNCVRVDIDDRVESVEKKVRDAEVDWVPLIVVVGKREKSSGKLAVRFRKDGKVKKMSVAQLLALIKKETSGKPYGELTLPREISLRPRFAG